MNLIRAKAGKNHARRDSAAADGVDADVDDNDEEEEESWTFVGADAEMFDDLKTEGIVKSSPLGTPSGAEDRALGSRVLGAGGGTGLGLGVRGAGVS